MSFYWLGFGWPMRCSSVASWLAIGPCGVTTRPALPHLRTHCRSNCICNGWREDLPQLQAWLDQPKLRYDVAVQPVVVGSTIYFGSSRTDRLLALDCATGAEKWTFATEGPVRLAPVVWENKIYCAADDSYLYCLDAGSGKLLWKFRGGPSDRQILGNGRLISTWPARGGPVIADGTVYFSAGIWPFMGIFIHALDAKTGAVVWTNDGDGSQFMRQPHAGAESFGGIAPQGPMAVLGDKLLIPGGRSVPGCYDRRTGKLLHYEMANNSKFGGGFDAAAAGEWFFNGGAAFAMTDGKYLGDFDGPLVLGQDVFYRYSKGQCRAYDRTAMGMKPVEAVDRLGVKFVKMQWMIPELAACNAPTAEVMISAGSRLVPGQPQSCAGPQSAAEPRRSARLDRGGRWDGRIAGRGRRPPVGRHRRGPPVLLWSRPSRAARAESRAAGAQDRRSRGRPRARYFAGRRIGRRLLRDVGHRRWPTTIGTIAAKQFACDRRRSRRSQSSCPAGKADRAKLLWQPGRRACRKSANLPMASLFGQRPGLRRSGRRRSHAGSHACSAGL